MDATSNSPYVGIPSNLKFSFRLWKTFAHDFEKKYIKKSLTIPRLTEMSLKMMSKLKSHITQLQLEY